jgi:hypothetical protein
MLLAMPPRVGEETDGEPPTEQMIDGDRGQADNGADNEEKNGKKVPDNQLVLKLAVRINRAYKKGVSRQETKIGIARAFLADEGMEDDEKDTTAQGLLRRLRRFPNLLNSDK